MPRTAGVDAQIREDGAIVVREVGLTAESEVLALGLERLAVAVRVPCDVSGEALLSALHLPASKGAIVVVGSTAALAPEVERRIRSLLEEAIAPLAVEGSLAVLTGATDAGIFSIIGTAMAGHDGALVGVAPVHLVTWPDRADEGDDPLALTPLEPHHSHFVLVDGESWGDETAALVGLAAALGVRGPALAVLFGGGPIAHREAMALVKAGVRVVVIAGSGRVASALAAAAEEPDRGADPGLAALVGDERCTVFPASGGPAELMAALRRELG